MSVSGTSQLRLRVRSGRATRARVRGSALENVFLYFFALRVAYRGVRYVSASPHLHSLSLFLSSKARFRRKLFNIRPRVFLQTVLLRLSAFLSVRAPLLRAQLFVFSNSRERYLRPLLVSTKFALHQAKLKINKHTASILHVASTCEVLQSDALAPTAEIECLKQLNRELLIKAIFALQKRW